VATSRVADDSPTERSPGGKLRKRFFPEDRVASTGRCIDHRGREGEPNLSPGASLTPDRQLTAD